ncbi:flagellar biosynthetic protein FliQ [Halarcobacter bivalviorum]|uniref:Flagellar export apparatus protein FliQ n=1 Tax=Halarcobacter bivalviorum TaxID=663364 RepID=A0AAX2ABI6_9BACT|nr:flagellar biosynthetic protein FliQ [Halarcobacter bivalviorum]AXH13355.1 flagellar export apparatus, transmembrane gate complex, FliQ component [Halarcobacter bivalviorum]RXK04781.1 flagellar export apparatus protein FliQ [Halarcobacter bivalviorum]RXK10041.1 flagellar export apparatus protein FliQ [Halarcobacter bivalviorum]
MDLIGIAENTVKIILILGLPSLIVSMVIGLIISIFQAVTQVSDASLSFVPKIIVVSIFVLITLPWVGDHITTYTKDLWDLILVFGE